MRSLAGSLADGVLADANLIPPRPPILPTNIRKVRGRSTETSNTKNHEKRCWDCKTLLYKVRKQGMSFKLPCACNLNESYVKMPVSA